LEKNSPIDLTNPGTYCHWSTVTIRYADEDRMGHVNNSAYGIWIEVARSALIAQYLTAVPSWFNTVLAQVKINYLKETRFPGEVRIGAKLFHIGNSSFRSGYGVFRDGTCLATAECVNVFFDTRSRTSVMPTDTVRKIMEQDMNGSSA
jgi:acyl-CoA thioester hydrolase